MLQDNLPGGLAVLRKLFIVGSLVLVLLLAAGFAAVLLAPRAESPVNEKSAARVKRGMTQAEVAAVFGGPPGDYRVGSRSRNFAVGLAPTPGNVLKEWRGDDGLVMVQFGPDGRVDTASFMPSPFRNDSLLDRLLDLLGL